MSRNIFKMMILLSATLLFFGCEEKKSDTPAEIHWDRDMCARCVMVISDRKNTLQLKDPKSQKVYNFDDIGCLAIWFRDEAVPYKDSVKIWVTDAKTGEWCDARSAFYTANNITPMAFGFSAYKNKESIKNGEEILTYKQVIEKIK